MKTTTEIILLVLSVLLFLYISTGESEECNVGNIQNLSNTINSYPINEVYLNTRNQSTCAGLVYNITYCYLVPVGSGNELNEATFALWEPTGNDSYKQVADSLSDINFNNVGCPDKDYTTVATWGNPTGNQAKAIYCRWRCFQPPLAVSQGYVLGLNLSSSDTSKRIFIAETTLPISSSNTTDGVCMAGKVQGSSDEYKCDNGTTSNNRTLLLYTTVYHCGSLTPPTNGSISSIDTFDSAVVTFTCDDQFTISPPLVLRCVGTQWRLNEDITSVWDQTTPKCSPAYCTYPDNIVDHASIISDDQGALFINGSIVTFKCNTGYHFYYTSTIEYQCVDGAWVTHYNSIRHYFTRCFPYECSLPVNIDPHGHLLLTDSIHRFPVNSTVRFSCDEGYVLSFTYPLMCLSNGTWNSSSPQCHLVIINDNSDDGYTISENYRFLIAAVVVVMFVILLTVICLLIVFLARKRGAQSANPGLTTLDKNGSLKQHLIPEDSAINDDEISPYSVVKMPMEVYVSTKDGTVTYINRPLSSNYNSPPPSIITSHGSAHPSMLSSHGSAHSSMMSSPPPISLVSHPRYSGRFSLGTSKPFESPLEELEQSLKSENPYWSPATVANELYLQLNEIKVKTITEKNLRILEELGSGEFATVNKGVLVSNYDADDVTVAIKSTWNTNDEDKAKFLREAAIMGQFHHVNVLKLFGVVVDKPGCTLIVVEYMSKGDLLSHLQKLKTIEDEGARSKLPYQLLNFTRQICLGMTYLSGKGFVHRDLAARNILVSEDDICKIADFGLSRDLDDESYYIVHEGAVIPVKWTAPEAIQQRKYSVASDVWSYGCTLYEIWSLGCKPFKGASTVNAIKIIKTGQRLTPPPGCPREIYHIMIKTWHPNPKERPSFNDLMLMLLKNDDELLIIPEDVASSQPNANQLGSDLKNGVNLYEDLQNVYLNK